MHSKAVDDNDPVSLAGPPRGYGGVSLNFIFFCMTYGPQREKMSLQTIFKYQRNKSNSFYLTGLFKVL